MSEKTITLPFKYNKIDKKGRHIALKASVNKQKLHLIIDTGASQTVFDKELVECFSIIKSNKEEIKSSGLTEGQLEGIAVKVKGLSVKKETIPDFKAVLLPLDHINSLYQSIDLPKISGLIGSDFLKKFKAVIDFKKQKLQLTIKS